MVVKLHLLCKVEIFVLRKSRQRQNIHAFGILVFFLLENCHFFFSFFHFLGGKFLTLYDKHIVQRPLYPIVKHFFSLFFLGTLQKNKVFFMNKVHVVSFGGKLLCNTVSNQLNLVNLDIHFRRYSISCEASVRQPIYDRRFYCEKVRNWMTV